MKNPLDNARPVRLSLRKGQWNLDFESLERTSDVVYRPIIFSVEGREPILNALEHMGVDEQLLSETKQLFEQVAARGDEQPDLNLEAKDDETWVPIAAEQFSFARTDGKQGSSSVDRIAMRRMALKRTVARMQQNGESDSRIVVLERRVAELEKQLKEVSQQAAVGPKINFGGAGGAAGVASGMTQEVPPDAIAAMDGEGAAGAGAARPDGDAPLKVRPVAAEGGDDSEAASPSSDRANEASPQSASDGEVPKPKDPAAEVSGKDKSEPAQEDSDSEPAQVDSESAKIPELPEVQDVQGMLRMLVGNEMKLSELSGDKVVSFSNQTKKFYIAKLIDDDDTVVGAMLADLKAVVRLGGGLLMMPEDVLQEQIDAGVPEEDVIESMSEVFNTASSLINESSTNPHIRVEAVKPLELEEVPWLEKPSSRLDMEDEHESKIIIASA